MDLYTRKSKAKKIFPEAVGPYDLQHGMTYYIIYDFVIEQLLVKLNQGHPKNIIIAGCVRIGELRYGAYASKCLKELLNEIYQKSIDEGKLYIKTRATELEGKRALKYLMDDLPKGFRLLNDPTYNPNEFAVKGSFIFKIVSR